MPFPRPKRSFDWESKTLLWRENFTILVASNQLLCFLISIYYKPRQKKQTSGSFPPGASFRFWISRVVQEELAFTFPHLRLFTLYLPAASISRSSSKKATVFCVFNSDFFRILRAKTSSEDFSLTTFTWPKWPRPIVRTTSKSAKDGRRVLTWRKAGRQRCTNSANDASSVCIKCKGK